MVDAHSAKDGQPAQVDPHLGNHLSNILTSKELKKEKVGHFPQSIPKDLMNVISTESWHCLSLDVEFSFWIRRNGEPVEPAAKMVQKCTIVGTTIGNASIGMLSRDEKIRVHPELQRTRGTQLTRLRELEVSRHARWQ